MARGVPFASPPSCLSVLLCGFVFACCSLCLPCSVNLFLDTNKDNRRNFGFSFFSRFLPVCLTLFTILGRQYPQRMWQQPHYLTLSSPLHKQQWDIFTAPLDSLHFTLALVGRERQSVAAWGRGYECLEGVFRQFSLLCQSEGVVNGCGLE